MSVSWGERVRAYESEVRGYFICCPICGSNEITVHLIHLGRDTLSCQTCKALWHLNYSITFKWAELEVAAADGKGSDLLGKRLKPSEWLKMAQNARKILPRADQPSRTKDKEVVTKEKEIVREKEVIVKVRCSYCHNPYDETLDTCPHCGAKR